MLSLCIRFDLPTVEVRAAVMVRPHGHSLYIPSQNTGASDVIKYKSLVRGRPLSFTPFSRSSVVVQYTRGLKG